MRKHSSPLEMRLFLGTPLIIPGEELPRDASTTGEGREGELGKAG
jgi:hypothetical protein